MVPEVRDRQGDVVGADEIEKAAYDFNERSSRVGLGHKGLLKDQAAKIVESYITRSATSFGNRTLPSGTWMVGVKVFHPKLRKAIREGKIWGFSMGGRGAAELGKSMPSPAVLAELQRLGALVRESAMP